MHRCCYESKFILFLLACYITTTLRRKRSVLSHHSSSTTPASSPDLLDPLSICTAYFCDKQFKPFHVYRFFFAPVCLLVHMLYDTNDDKSTTLAVISSCLDRRARPCGRDMSAWRLEMLRARLTLLRTRRVITSATL